jgi:hypothetical protein
VSQAWSKEEARKKTRPEDLSCAYTPTLKPWVRTGENEGRYQPGTSNDIHILGDVDFFFGQ